jgi:hypothetical protein
VSVSLAVTTPTEKEIETGEKCFRHGGRFLQVAVRSIRLKVECLL